MSDYYYPDREGHNRDGHPNHNQGANLMLGATVGAVNDFIESCNSHFQTLPRGHRHLVAAVYGKKYLQEATIKDELAAASHRDRDYKTAANSLDAANDEFAGMHQMMAYNMGVDHPLVKKMAEFRQTRDEMTSAYRKTLGLHEDDLNKRFNDIVGNLNIGQQFKPRED